jgi:lipopolysaccharide export system permease protein
MAAGLIAGFLPLLQKGMEAGAGITVILFQVLVSALPSTLVSVLPLSIMIGILLGLGRMSQDNEIAAMKSAGISVLKLLPPVIFLGLIGFAVSIYCTLVLIPKGISTGKQLIFEAATKRIDAGIEEKVFFDSLKNLMVYVDHIEPGSGVLHRVFIKESSDPDDVKTILAAKGKAQSDPEGKDLVLDLRQGTIIKENKMGDTTGTLSFETYVFRFPITLSGVEKPSKSFEEMSITEIRERSREAVVQSGKIEDPKTLEFFRKVQTMASIIITQRFIHPAACLALAIFAFPIGMVNIGKSRLNNVSLGLIGVFVYYAFTLSVERAARSVFLPPELVLPLPALFFFVGSAYLINLVRRERLPEIMADFSVYFRKMGMSGWKSKVSESGN